MDNIFDRIIKDFRIGIIILVFFVGFITGISIWNYTSYNKACQEIGFIRYQSIGGISTCEDSNGDLHYIKNIQEGFFIKPKFKEISVGGVRIVNDR